MGMGILEQAAENLRRLGANPYPGRGIVAGLSPDGGRLVQVYWIMGRSPASQNRVLLQEGEAVKSESLDPSRVPNPALLIYHPVRRVGSRHVVSNGDQTDTVVAALQRGDSFAASLAGREFEPDPPHYTPRIAALCDAADPARGYQLAILKSLGNDPAQCLRHFYTYAPGRPGIGHCIMTYAGDGDPLPSFVGEPWAVPTYDDPERTAAVYWDLLHPERRVGLLVKFVEVGSGRSTIRILNRHTRV